MPPQLVALSEGPNILLDKPILLLGRHQECDIQLASRKVSRRHCCIAQVSDYLVVRDLGSTNGIRINGVRVQEGTLRIGDELTIGNHRYEVKWPEDSNGPAPPESKPAEKEGPLGQDVDGSLKVPDPPPSVVDEQGAAAPTAEDSAKSDIIPAPSSDASKST